jgi:hypothetical protein
MWNQEPLSGLSDAWQWLYHRTICNECHCFGVLKRTPNDFPELVLPLPDLTRTGVTASHQAFTMWNQEPLSNFSDEWQWFYHKNNLQWMSLLGRLKKDTWWFSRVGAAFARFDKDSSDSCSTGIHHAEPRNSERLVRCMTMILSQNNLQWISLLGRLNREPDNFPELMLPLPDVTRTGVTAAHQAFTMRNQEPLSVLSDAWQWFYHRTICNECHCLGV